MEFRWFGEIQMGLRHFVTACKALVFFGLIVFAAPTLRAQANPGDPLFCDPNEGNTFLIVNGGAGVFTVNSDCYGNNPAADTQTVITTGRGGTLTKGPGTSLNYIYTPPTPTFTGLDTFSISVTTTCNRVGGTGTPTAGGTTCPGGPGVDAMTLNVLPSTMTFPLTGGPITIPLPAGSVSGCVVTGNSGTGPAPTDVVGCTTRLIRAGGVNPTQGTLSTSGTGLIYTPTTNSPDTFTVQVQGINVDGSTSLNSGTITVNITNAPGVPTLGIWGLALLGTLLLLFGVKATKQPIA